MPMSQVTQLLTAIQTGDNTAASRLLPLVYDELRRLAAQRLASEQPSHNLQPTELVHEAFLKLVGPANADGYEGQRHFFAAAAEAMRRILIDEARKRCSAKHGGQFQRIKLDENSLLDSASDSEPAQLLVLDDALRQFEKVEPLKAEYVKLRYFGGLSIAEAAASLKISEATGKRYWVFAKAWLYGKVKTLSQS
jgi:RNA polymerase sigma factor (TIGR02999 family)